VTSGDHLVQTPPPLKQGHLEQAAQDCAQGRFEHLQKRRLHNHLGSLFQCSITLNVNKLFLVFRGNFLCFSLCPSPFVLLLGTTEPPLDSLQ